MVETTLPVLSWRKVQITLGGVVAASWLILIALSATPYGALLHHGPSEVTHDLPLTLRWAGFLAGWALMVTAMMLPGDALMVKSFLAALPGRDAARARGLLSFGLGYLGVWLLFGAALYGGDMLLHRAVEASAAASAAAEAWAEHVIPVVLLAAAGLYQLSPLQERFLQRQHAHGSQLSGRPGAPFVHGLRGGLLCLGSCGAAMLVLFALAGGLDLLWMAVLTAYTMALTSAAGKYLAWALGLAMLAAAGLRLMV